MNRLWALCINTFKEAVRDRVLHSILFFAVGVVVLSLALKEVTIGDQAKVVRSIGQSGIDFFASVIAMFLGISTIWKELEKKTIYTLLSKPIPRWMFLMGKYAGLMLTVIVEVVLLAVLYSLLMMVQQSFPPPVFFVSVALLIVELMLITAWSILFSSYSAPTTATAFMIATFCIGHLADDIWLFSNSAETPIFRQMGSFLYWTLPNFEALSIREAAIHGREIPWERVGFALMYGLSYTMAVLVAATAIFKRRDIP
ncbi:MAG: ABC transporter permease subunit [Myxococcota bacterium]|nr:ABC transporter permease subunit [Myxococcota bacterium]